jgi:hypothetical protein
MMAATALKQRPPPIEVKIYRPLVYAIQQVPGAVRLFLARVTDSR